METGDRGQKWVLLAAGSKGWENYRHQANVCHAYQVVQQSGVPEEQIVVMMYDDVAGHEENPVCGNIINVPNGPNVYPGVPKDYTGEDVSAENFLSVLRGDSSAVHKTGRRKVIQSGRNDSIFIYLSDHGAHGIFGFPHSTLYADDLINTLKIMTQNQQFSKMVIYMESCHAGSMLDQLTDTNVFAVASCSATEYAYAWFWDRDRNTYLADVFSVYWLHHTETKRRTMDEALRKIAELTHVSGALTDRQEVTGTHRLKVVAEHFRKNLFNWEEEPFVVTPSHLQVLVNLCESGLAVQSIMDAVSDVSRETTDFFTEFKNQ